MDDEGEGRRQDVRRGDRGKPERERRLQAREQRALSSNCVRRRTHVSGLEVVAVRRVSGRPRQLLRNGSEVCQDERGRPKSVYRSRWLQELCGRERAVVPRGIGETDGSGKIGGSS